MHKKRELRLSFFISLINRLFFIKIVVLVDHGEKICAAEVYQPQPTSTVCEERMTLAHIVRQPNNERFKIN